MGSFSSLQKHEASLQDQQSALHQELKQAKGSIVKILVSYEHNNIRLDYYVILSIERSETCPLRNGRRYNLATSVSNAGLLWSCISINYACHIVSTFFLFRVTDIEPQHQFKCQGTFVGHKVLFIIIAYTVHVMIVCFWFHVRVLFGICA